MSFSVALFLSPPFGLFSVHWEYNVSMICYCVCEVVVGTIIKRYLVVCGIWFIQLKKEPYILVR